MDKQGLMDDLALHPQTRLACEALLSEPSHALIVAGERGSGTSTLARSLALGLVAKPASILTISPDNSNISIDDIQRLYTTTRASRTEPLVVIVDEADTMSREAQNALLKLFEEPPKNVYFILATHAAHRLLPTIASRAAHVSIRPLSRSASQEFLAARQVTDAAQQAKLLFLASGRPAELCRLIDDQAYYEAASGRMSDAKRFLGASAYDRLLIAKAYVSNREDCEAFLVMVGQLLAYTLQRSVSDASLGAIDAVNRALDNLAANGNMRAQLLGVSDRISRL